MNFIKKMLSVAFQDTFRPKENIVVVIPAYNSQDSIGEIIHRTRKWIRDVIVIDDGSSDNTSSEATKAGAKVITGEGNSGYTAAVKKGMKLALEYNYKYLITLDSDGEHNPDDIPKYLEAYEREKTPIIIGNRYHKGNSCTLERKIKAFITSLFIKKITNCELTDPMCGFRFFDLDYFNKNVKIRSSGFGMPLETILEAFSKKLSMIQIPICYISRKDKEDISVKANELLDGLRVLSRYCSPKDNFREIMNQAMSNIYLGKEFELPLNERTRLTVYKDDGHFKIKNPDKIEVRYE